MRSRRLGYWSRGALALAALFGVAVSSSCSDDITPDSLPCQGSEEDFVQRASMALTGRVPRGAAERAVWADALRALKAQGHSVRSARGLVARAMMQGGAYENRWFEAIIDMLQVPRHPTASDGTWEGVRAVPRCYEEPVESITDELAIYVRDNGPFEQEPPRVRFTMGNLLRSSLQLDDLSPVYRAHLLYFVTNPIAGANLSEDELELERRKAFGLTFESAYLNRDPSCLTCHNSEFTVAPTNALGESRFFPINALLEQSVYGTSTADVERVKLHSVFRHRDVVVNDDCGSHGCEIADRVVPWNWDSTRCGALRQLDAPDSLGINATFGSVGSTEEDPSLGLFATVFQVEGALRRGFEGLVQRGGAVAGADGAVDDEDVAFAYLVSLTIAEKVWLDTMGRPLTISHHFPRTEAQRALLEELAAAFIKSNYSLKALLEAIVSHPAFNVQVASAGCGEEYGLEPIFDPFAIDRTTGPKTNSVGDRVQAWPTRMVRAAFHDAMGWEPPPRFPPPTGEEQSFQVSTGYFNSREAPGFWGLDFQSRLVWESAYYGCSQGTGSDYITELVQAGADKGATVEEVIVTLRDRLTGEGPLSDHVERELVSELMGKSLGSKVSSTDEEPLRIVCGAIVASPQFMLGGPVLSTKAPTGGLTLPGYDYASECATAADAFSKVGVTATCSANAIDIQP